jgi:fluoroacetyl-CoA thioesterase
VTRPPARAGVELKPGLQAEVERVVPREWTLAHFDTQLPDVFSTPAMIGMMEQAAAQAVQPALPAGAITVGTRIEVDHLKAVPAGAHVHARARLERIDGRFLVFEVEARSGDLLLGRGRVYRAIVQNAEFASKAQGRAAKQVSGPKGAAGHTSASKSGSEAE